jgi:hypothetical protein
MSSARASLICLLELEVLILLLTTYPLLGGKCFRCWNVSQILEYLHGFYWLSITNPKI